MIDKTYLNIIVNAESDIYENGGLLSECYRKVFSEAENQEEFYSKLLEVVEVFEEDLEGQRHENNVLMDVVSELVYNKVPEINLKKYQPNKKYWRFDYPIEKYRVKQHKKAIGLAVKSTISMRVEDEFKNEGWFKVSLLFASGEIESLLKKHKHNATQIAKDRFKDNWDKYRPHISDSMNADTAGSKNIFSNRGKMLKVIEHCKENNINVVSSYLDKLPPE